MEIYFVFFLPTAKKKKGNPHPHCSTFANRTNQRSKPKACKKASASPARLISFQDGIRIAHAQKNKINLCFVDRLVQIDNDKKNRI